MYTMNRALQEVAAGYAGNTAYAAGNRAVALPGHSGTGNNSLFIIIAIVIAVCACGGFGGNECCNGRRRRRIRFGSSGLLLLILGLLLVGGGNRGSNLNTNVINVNAQADDGGDDDGFLDI